MALQLKKLKEIGLGVARQVNPLDNGRTWKQRTPTTNQSALSQAGGLAKRNLIDPAVQTAQRSANTYGALDAGVRGLASVGFNELFNNELGAQRAVQNTNRVIQDRLNNGFGGVGGFVSAENARTRGGGLQGYKDAFVNPVIQGSAEIAPYVIPIGGIGAKGPLRARVGKQAGANAVVAGGANAANQYAQTGQVDPLQAAKASALGGALGGGVPLVGAALRKSVSLAKGPTPLVAPKRQIFATKPAPSNTVKRQVFATRPPQDPMQTAPRSIQQELPRGPIAPASNAPAYERNFGTPAATQARDYALRQRYGKLIRENPKAAPRLRVRLKELLDTPMPQRLQGEIAPPAQQPAPVAVPSRTANSVVRPMQQSQRPKVALSSAANKRPDTSPAPTEPAQLPQDFNPLAYAKEQTKRQEQARKGSVVDKLQRGKATFKAKFVDNFAPIEDVVRKAERDVTINPKDNITYAIDRALQSNRISGQYMKDNGLDRIVQAVPNTKTFDQYLIAKRAPGLEARGIKTGRDVAKDEALVRRLEPEYEAAAQEVYKYSQNLLDKAVEYGLVNKQTAAQLKRDYPDYVPMERIFDENELAAMNQGNGKGRASRSTQSVVQRMKGSAREVESPLDSIIRKTQTVVEQGESNNAARILASYRELPNNPFQLRELTSSETAGAKPVISYLDNGKPRRFETTPEVAAAAKSLNQEQMGLLGRILATPTRVLRLGATGANVGFALANVARDTVSSFVNGKRIIANPAVFLDALEAAVFHRGQKYQELLREGAAGTSFDIARRDPTRNVVSLRAGKNAGTRIAYTVRHPSELLRAVENTIGRSEEFTRAVQYYGNKRAYLKQGKNASDARLMAANDARNNTVNFSRAGEYGRMLNVVLPYFNAGIQGARTFVRSMRDRPLQTSAKVAVSTLMPMAAVTAWNLSDPERKAAYDDLRETSPYELENNFVIIPPNPKKDDSGRWNVIKIPLSQEVASLADGVRRGVESWQGDSKFDFGRLAAELTGSTTSLKTGSLREAANQFTPQAVKPGVEMLANQNLFFGNQIVPDAMKNLAPEDQVQKNTSGTAKVVGGALGASPLTVDNAIRTATAGAGQNLINASDRLLAATGKISDDEVKGKGLIPSITNRFDGAQGSTSGGLYFKSIQDAAKKQKLAGKDYNLLNALKSKEIDGDGVPIPQNEQDALNNASIRANNPRIVEVEAAAARTLAKKTGQPLDPIYELSPEQRQTYYRIQASPYKGDDYNRLSDKAKDWLPTFQQERSAFFDGLNKDNSTGVTPTARVQYPTFDDQTQSKLDAYFNTTDSQERAAFLSQNPDVSDAFDQINQYTNARRVAQGYDPFGAYPEPGPQAKAAMDAYFALPKEQKSGWIEANPGAYALVQQSLADSAAWQLANNAGEAKYEGETLNQKALKSAYSLGKYSIFKDSDTGEYSINPTEAYLANYASRYGSSGGSSSSLGGDYGVSPRTTRTVSKPKVSVSKGQKTRKVSRAKGKSGKTGGRYKVSLKRAIA